VSESQASVHAASVQLPPAHELVILENDSLRIKMWPRMGGKIVSIVVRARVGRRGIGERELLHAPIHAYSPATDTSSFALSDAGGWDECLPSVASCTVGDVEIPDHGDVWRKPWTAVLKNDAILARVEAFSLPLRFSRWLSLDGPAMHLRYAVTNTGQHGTDFLWSAHPLFQVEEGDRIVLPDTVHQVRVEGTSVERLVRNKDYSAWPIAELANGGHLDLSTVGALDGRTAHKFFAGPLTTGWCGLYRAKLKMGIVMRFDPGQTPFAGLWISQGAWPQQNDGAKQYTVALEPTTAICDGLDHAATLGCAQHLLPQAEYSWPLQFEVFGSHESVEYEQFLVLASTQPRH
jgi:hypothetical protein